jgi:hypothetical protein
VGDRTYVASEQWDLLEFEFQGEMISSAPAGIPQVGQVRVPNYLVTEVCGTVFLDRHRIRNTVGGILKWAVTAALGLAMCDGGACFHTVEQALAQAFNCQLIAMQLDALIASAIPVAPSIAGLVELACEIQRDILISDLMGELNGLTTKMSLLELSGVAELSHPDQPSHGVWHGVLGNPVDKGNFDGKLTMQRWLDR